MSDGDVVTMSSFGNMGRFGNQVFQKAFLEIYAKEHGCRLELPPWCGRELFGCDEPEITVTLPRYDEPHTDSRVMGRHEPPVGDEVVNHNWSGYAQFHTSWYAPHKEFVRSLFTPTQYALDRVQGAYEKLRNVGKTIVGIHIRRGDYGRILYPRIPVEWYVRWLHEHWEDLDDPVLVYCSENVGLMNEFVKYDPTTAEELGVQPLSKPVADYRDLAENYKIPTRSLDFWPDWYLLSKCDVLLMPPTTFSFTAAMMNTNLKTAYRATAGFGGFQEIDVWNADPMPHEWCEDYRHVPGLCLDHNPPHYWRCPNCHGLQVNAAGQKCKQCNGFGTVGKPTAEWVKRWRGIKI